MEREDREDATFQGKGEAISRRRLMKLGIYSVPTLALVNMTFPARVLATSGGGLITALYGLITGKFFTYGPMGGCFFSIFRNGTRTNYEVDGTTYEAYHQDDVIRFTLDVEGRIEETSAPAQPHVTNPSHRIRIKLINSTTRIISLGAYDTDNQEVPGGVTPATFLVDTNTQYFNLNGDGPATAILFGDMSVGAEVKVYYDPVDDTTARVIVVQE